MRPTVIIGRMHFRVEVEKRERILADEEMEISTNQGTQLYCRVWFAPRALHRPCFHAGGAHRSCSGSESHGHTWLSTSSRKTTPPTAHALQTPTKPPMGMREMKGGGPKGPSVSRSDPQRPSPAHLKDKTRECHQHEPQLSETKPSDQGLRAEKEMKMKQHVQHEWDVTYLVRSTKVQKIKAWVEQK